MSNVGITIESDGDRNYGPKPNADWDAGTGSRLERQDGGELDDSALYDTDVESEADRLSSAGNTAISLCARLFHFL